MVSTRIARTEWRCALTNTLQRQRVALVAASKYRHERLRYSQYVYAMFIEIRCTWHVATRRASQVYGAVVCVRQACGVRVQAGVCARGAVCVCVQ